MLSKKRQLTQH